MIRVLVKHREQGKVVDKYLEIDESLYPKDYDFYELVASELKWKGKEDPMWYLSQHNYIYIERLKDENDLL